MTDLYHYTELTAALGLLVAVSLGALVWSITSMPSHVRSTERNRLSHRLPAQFAPSDDRSHTSVVVPTRNGEAVIEDTVRTLAGHMRPGDEIIVVENGSTDSTTSILDRMAAEWTDAPSLVVLHSGPGLGEALRTGVLASTGQWLLLTADDLPFGFSDYDQFTKLPADAVVAIGSKAHPDSTVIRSRRRVIQSRVFRFLRAALLQSKVGDSQGTIWVDGDWARSFSLLSRETGLMWTTELVLAAEQQGVSVREVPVSLSDAHETGSSRFRFSDAWQSVIGFTRLAIYKDDYANEVWTRSTAEEESTDSDAEVATPATAQ
jgi:glycosyltransferase involved in cell wall biosynthesis